MSKYEGKHTLKFEVIKNGNKWAWRTDDGPNSLSAWGHSSPCEAYMAAVHYDVIQWDHWAEKNKDGDDKTRIIKVWREGNGPYRWAYFGSHSATSARLGDWKGPFNDTVEAMRHALDYSARHKYKVTGLQVEPVFGGN